ncbi:hypothetical protein EJ04DRAFT_565879 [Polyplosphaeria fusca]|uniref:Uncharacterized protein n=1 Tax=Polyplosphaeria fusca TaxID=682080 RepID=A0A9P4V1Q2_9PLEO|nr:hypothetical protein EJ04DRAFT_565879 [Polyplosphaeria fusca]
MAAALVTLRTDYNGWGTSMLDSRNQARNFVQKEYDYWSEDAKTHLSLVLSNLTASFVGATFGATETQAKADTQSNLVEGSRGSLSTDSSSCVKTDVHGNPNSLSHGVPTDSASESDAMGTTENLVETLPRSAMANDSKNHDLWNMQEVYGCLEEYGKQMISITVFVCCVFPFIAG